MFYLGVLLSGGGGVEMDRVKGYMWLTLASVLIDPSFKGIIEGINQALELSQTRMSEEDMERGREMAWEWQRKRHAKKAGPGRRARPPSRSRRRH